MKDSNPDRKESPAEPPAGGAPQSETSISDLFQAELEQQTAALTHFLLELDKGETRPEILQNLMRAAHSLKGAARIANRRTPIRIAHQMEECFVLAQHGALCLDRADVDVLLKIVDFLSEQKDVSETGHEDTVALQVAGQLSALDKIAARSSARMADSKAVLKTSGGNAAAPRAENNVQVENHALIPHPERYLRLATESLNRLLGLASESLIEARWLHPFADSLRQLASQHLQMAKAIEMLRLTGSAGHADLSRAHMESLAAQVDLARQSLTSRIQELEEFDRRADQMSRRLYLEVLRARMRPLSDLSRRLPRMVRDLSRLLGKNVRLEVVGENTQVDRELLDRIEAPLVHLLRNAVDHGCETPEVRQRAGKSPECVVRVEARHNGGALLIRVADDGIGVDPALLRRQVAQKALADPQQLRAISDTQLLDYLFVPGFTLREKTTEISGRGIGLDIVHTAVRNLRGSLRVINRPGKGMEFQIQLPLTVSVIRALIVEVDGEPYALPLGRITRAAKLTSKHVEWIQEIPHFRYCGRHIALASARQVFGYDPATDNTDEFLAVVLGESEPRFGIIVDKFIGERELLVQSLDARLGKVRDITASALMDDGRPVLIVDVQEVIRSIERLGALGRLAAFRTTI